MPPMLPFVALLALCWLQTLGNLTPTTPIASTLAFAALFGVCLCWPGTPHPPKSFAPRRPWRLITLGLAASAIAVGALLVDAPPYLQLVMWAGAGLIAARLVAPALRIQALGLWAAAGTITLWLPPGGSYQNLALLPPGWHLGAAVGLAAALAFAGVLALKRPAFAIAPLIVAMIALRAAGLETWQIHPGTRDMLALIHDAQDTFLAGQNAYGIYQMQHGSQIPLTYLPGMWLGSLWPRLLGLDLRLATLVWEAGMWAALWWAAPQATQRARILGFGALWLVLPSTQWNFIYAEPTTWWALLAITLAFHARGKTIASAVALGLALCTRHFAVLLLPFFLLSWLRRLGPRATAEPLGLTAGVCALGLTPWIVADPDAFWFGTLTWLRAYGPAHHTWFYDKFSFAQPLYTSGAITWAPLMQAIGLALCAALYAWRLRLTPRARPWPLALATLMFIQLNGLVWFSFFLGALLTAVVTTLPSQPPAQPTRTWWRPALLIGGLVCGGLIASTFYDHISERGRAEASAALVQRGATAAQIVDHTRRRLAFIQPPQLGPSARRATLAWSTLFSPPTQLFYLSKPSFTPDPARPDLTAIFAPANRDQFGPIELTHLAAPGRLDALSDAFKGPARTLSINYLDLAAKPPTKHPLTPAPQGVWQTSPPMPPWAKAFVKRCEIPGASGDMISVHPVDDHVLNISWPQIRLGERVVVTAGLETPAVRWGRAHLELEVSLSLPGQKQLIKRRLKVENRPGLQGVVLDTSAYAGAEGTLELALSSPDAAQRWSCLQAWVVTHAPD